MLCEALEDVTRAGGFPQSEDVVLMKRGGGGEVWCHMRNASDEGIARPGKKGFFIVL